MYGILAFIFFVVGMFGNTDAFLIAGLFTIADEISTLNAIIKNELK